MTDQLINLHGDVLAAMRRGPKNFERLSSALSDHDDPSDHGLDLFRERLISGDPALKALWGRTLTSWDLDESASWSTTEPQTDARRTEVYAKLGFGSDICKALGLAVPLDKGPRQLVISDAFQRWYTKDTAAVRPFYWTAYERLLRSKGWSDRAVASLDEASHSIIERLADPTRSEAYGARGLVVGYVQSGKTANFTGVIAKAIDAGYRLVIVLGGTLNLLRGQTQRRLDMELIGRENILRGAAPEDVTALVGIDYQDDEDWPHKFVSHGGRPSTLGAFDIERLTTRLDDYKGLMQGIRALDIEKLDRTLPLYDPANLHHAAARVMVVKKNKSVLEKLVQDLKKIGPILTEVPALIIDDESDQASVNTTDPRKWEAGKVTRTAINGQISALLKLLPRGQYVGYTATPFANVLVNPDDGEDIFPRDFLLSLPRPSGYMGVQDFHDLESTIPASERNSANSQEKAHVRGIYKDTGDRLLEAMDAFVLAGALKLYRIRQGIQESKFRHHTMLVHESVKMADHAALAQRLNTMWHSSYGSSESHERLAELFESDFSIVSQSRANGLPVPPAYEDLRPHISRARQLISSGGHPVIVVNGDSERDYEQAELDFDRTPNVWKILVGGTKLSRGFTVEGLTITYYRRKTQQADTLMQMGRWFGFRDGYRDLVRLYIGREEPFGKDKTIDLYEAFEAICQDEETFRAQLGQYAEMIEGEPQLTPSKVLPLVSQHLALVKPSARNKMFHSELVEIRSPGKPIEPAAYPESPEGIRRNTERWRPLLHVFGAEPKTLALPPDESSPLRRTFQAKTTLVSHSALVSVLSQLEWEGDNHFRPHLNYLAQLDGTLARVDKWLLVAPLTSASQRVEASVLDSAPCSLVRRNRQLGKASFGRISGLEHRRWAQALIDNAQSDGASHTDRLAIGRQTGVVLLYPAVEAKTDAELRSAAAQGVADPSKVILAFTIFSPREANDSSRRLLRYQAKRSGN
ncbi:Z1 domain-containing protein [Streptomyces purpureus]|uniref:Z1 domain-containing protein n=1 Tax=Streptomyces purpureus TaxID=1951 RepID=UPI00036C3BB4|nr:Z1 domain-containing protein [Streptomyces purpureus]